MRLILTHFTSNLCEFQHVTHVTAFFKKNIFLLKMKILSILRVEIHLKS